MFQKIEWSPLSNIAARLKQKKPPGKMEIIGNLHKISVRRVLENKPLLERT